MTFPANLISASAISISNQAKGHKQGYIAKNIPCTGNGSPGHQEMIDDGPIGRQRKLKREERPVDNAKANQIEQYVQS